MADQRLVADLNRLIRTPPAPRPRLAPVTPPGSLPGRSSASPAAAATGTTAGIASPLTEPDYTAREYHAATVLTTTDGVFTLEIEPLAAVALQDANSAAVRIEFAAPP